MVCARRLHAWGGDVTVLTTAPDERHRGEPAKQLDILGRMDVPVSHAVGGAPLPGADLVIDAMIGYSLSGAPAGVAASLVRATNLHVAPVLSLDLPSGVDATTGRVAGPAVRATATLTLALPKTGLFSTEAAPFVGELYLADIGVPPQLYASPTIGLDVGAIFAANDIVRLR